MALMNEIIAKYEREAQQRIQEVQKKNREKELEREKLFWKPPVGAPKQRKLISIPPSIKPPKSVWDAKPLEEEEPLDPQPVTQAYSTVAVAKGVSGDIESISRRIEELQRALDELKAEVQRMRQ